MQAIETTIFSTIESLLVQEQLTEEQAFRAKVFTPLLPIIVKVVKGVEATFLAPSEEKHRMAVGTLKNFYNNLEIQPLPWEDIEGMVNGTIPSFVSFYHDVKEFKHNVRQVALAEVENMEFDATPPTREKLSSTKRKLQWVDSVAVYQGCVPTIEADLDSLPDSLQAAIDEHYSVN